MAFNIKHTSIGTTATRIREFLTDNSPLQDVILRKAKREADKGDISDWHSTCRMLGVMGAEFIVCNDTWHSDSIFDTRIAILETPTQTHIQTIDTITILDCATLSDGSNKGSGWAMTQVKTENRRSTGTSSLSTHMPRLTLLIGTQCGHFWHQSKTIGGRQSVSSTFRRAEDWKTDAG
jgi:hypothetical protein